MHNASLSAKLILALLFTLFSTATRALPEGSSEHPQWFEKPYAYVLVEQDVRAALQEFGHNLGLIVVLSDGVRGKSRGNVRGETAGDFLNMLCDSSGLNWYYDGNILYLAADTEITTRLFKAEGQQRERLQDYLASLDVYGKQMSVRPSPNGDELFVSGPPAYLAMIQQHVDYLHPPVPAQQAARERGVRVRVFRGGAVTEVSH